MDPAVLPTASGASGSAQPNFNKLAEPEILISKEDGPTCSTFEDPLAASANSNSYTDTCRSNVTASSLSDDVMNAADGSTETSPHLDKIVQKDGLGPGPGGDTSDSENKRTSSLEPIDAVMAEIDKAVKMECMQWTHVFTESEQFEMLSSDHVDKLLEDAKALEENLIEQKERLLSHLKLLSQTLKLP